MVDYVFVYYLIKFKLIWGCIGEKTLFCGVSVLPPPLPLLLVFQFAFSNKDAFAYNMDPVTLILDNH